MNDKNNDQMVTKVKEALQKKAGDIKGADIFVSVEGENIILKGVVDSAKERDKAVEIAKSVEGVKSVKEEFRILADQDQPDAGMKDTQHPGYKSSDDQGCSPSPRVG